MLDRLTTTAPLSGPDEHAHATIVDWIVAAVETPRLKQFAALLPIDIFSWKATSRDIEQDRSVEQEAGGSAPLPEPDGQFLTAARLHPAPDLFKPEALDLPLPDHPTGQGIESTRQAILDYLFRITWGQSEGTAEELHHRIDKAAARLYEAALIVLSHHDEAAEEMSRQSATAPSHGKGSRKSAKRTPDDDGIPF